MFFPAGSKSSFRFLQLLRLSFCFFRRSEETQHTTSNPKKEKKKILQTFYVQKTQMYWFGKMPLHRQLWDDREWMWGFFHKYCLLLLVEVHGEVMAFCAGANKQVNIFQTFLHHIIADKCVSVQRSSHSARINIAHIL